MCAMLHKHRQRIPTHDPPLQELLWKEHGEASAAMDVDVDGMNSVDR